MNSIKFYFLFVLFLVSTVDRSKQFAQINNNSDFTILDDQESDVIVKNQLLADICSKSEQPFPNELICSGLGIASLQNVNLGTNSPAAYRKLDLAANRLTKLSKSSFDLSSTRYLYQFDLSNNRLQTIESGTFDSFVNLASLNLANNDLQTLPSDLFENLFKLLEVNLANNQLLLTAQAPFPLARSVRRLDLSNNPYLFTKNSDFLLGADRLPNLVQLRLTDCGLKSLPNDLFVSNEKQALSKIQRLDLSGNRFDKIPTITLQKLSRLHVLILNDIPTIYSINREQLIGLKQLRSIHLNRLSRLRNIGVLAFSQQSLLREFVCTQNPKLIRIEANAFHLSTNNQDENFDFNTSSETTSDEKKVPLAAKSTKWWPANSVFVSKNELLQKATTPPLRVLHLQQNALSTVNQFLVNFKRLRSFDLSGNPLRCDCGLNFIFQLPQYGVQMRHTSETKCFLPRRWSEQTLYQAAALSTGYSTNVNQLSAVNSSAAALLSFNCQKLFDEENNVFWSIFLLLSACFLFIVMAFCALSAYVGTRILDCFHNCCALVGFRQSLFNCFDCCGLLQTKGRYRTFEREERRRDQMEPAERIRADLEWDDNEMDL